MSKHDVKRQDGKPSSPAVEPRQQKTGAQGGQTDRMRRLAMALLAFAFIAAAGLPSYAQTPTHPTPTRKGAAKKAPATRATATQAAVKQAPGTPPQPTAEVPCLKTGLPLVKVPELASVGGKLRGTIVLSDEEVRMTFRQPYRLPDDPNTLLTRPNNNAVTKCYPQHVRAFRGVGASPAPPDSYVETADHKKVVDPLPGPTLRARVGDLIQLTFINQINTANFPYTMDEGDKGDCDQVAGVYPGRDTFPDCFHGSSTGNIHFHGTHTNPNTTGDNVLLEIRPSPRAANGQPRVTPESVKRPFKEFFAQCERELSKRVLSEWPTTWDDLPVVWTNEQRQLLKQYDDKMAQKYGDKFKPLWPINKKQLEQGAWPQFYVGAYPYCFRLPEYPASNDSATADHTMSHGGAGTAEAGAITRPLMMGQAPGTHWYHAHKHGSTAINVANGMTGAFIIEGQYDDDLNDWYGKDWTRTQPVMVINQLGVSTNLMRKSQQIDKGPDFSVNGRLRPVVQMKPGEVQMWRLLNTSGRAGTYFAGPPKGFHWMQLAQDGVQFHDDNYQNSLDKPILLASGNRADLLVKAPDSCAAPNDCALMVQNEVDPGDLSSASPVTFLTVNITGNKDDVPPHQREFIPKAPKFPHFLDDIPADKVTGTKKLVFATVGSQGGPTAPGNLNSPPMQTINGESFDGEVGAVVLLNTTEEWTVMNTTPNIAHPFHIHINPFQIVEVFEPNAQIPGPNGKPIPRYVFQPGQLVPDPKDSKKYLNCLLDAGNPDTWKNCHPPAQTTHRIWWDVFPIPSGIKATDANGKAIIDPKTGKQMVIPGYFKMRSRFVDYSGYYVLHCHILAHEDRGMMTIVEVAPARTPYSHH